MLIKTNFSSWGNFFWSLFFTATCPLLMPTKVLSWKPSLCLKRQSLEAGWSIINLRPLNSHPKSEPHLMVQTELCAGGFGLIGSSDFLDLWLYVHLTYANTCPSRSSFAIWGMQEILRRKSVTNQDNLHWGRNSKWVLLCWG